MLCECRSFLTGLHCVCSHSPKLKQSCSVKFFHSGELSALRWGLKYPQSSCKGIRSDIFLRIQSSLSIIDARKFVCWLCRSSWDCIQDWKKKYYLIYFSIEFVFVWQMWGTVSLDGVQTFIAISADWYLNVAGFNTVGSDVNVQSIFLDQLSVVFLDDLSRVRVYKYPRTLRPSVFSSTFPKLL